MDPRSDLAPWYLKLAFVGARVRALFGLLFLLAFVSGWFVELKLVHASAWLALLLFVTLTPAKWVMRLNEQARAVRG